MIVKTGACRMQGKNDYNYSYNYLERIFSICVSSVIDCGDNTDMEYIKL